MSFGRRLLDTNSPRSQGPKGPDVRTAGLVSQSVLINHGTMINIAESMLIYL